MTTLALNLHIRDKVAVVIGGGAVALRKARTLLAAGAAVTVVAPDICPGISALAESGLLAVRQRDFTASDLARAFLAVAATNDSRVNGQVRAAAQAYGCLVMVADNPETGDFTLPALLRRGDLEIAVSTGGRCPAFAAQVRDVIAGQIGDNYGVILDQLADEREKLLTNGSSSTYNAQVLRLLAGRLLAELTDCKEPTP